jgi:hypothetical protein
VGTRVLEYSPALDNWVHAKLLKEIARPSCLPFLAILNNHEITVLNQDKDVSKDPG